MRWQDAALAANSNKFWIWVGGEQGRGEGWGGQQGRMYLCSGTAIQTGKEDRWQLQIAWLIQVRLPHLAQWGNAKGTSSRFCTALSKPEGSPYSLQNAIDRYGVTNRSTFLCCPVSAKQLSGQKGGGDREGSQGPS